MAATFVSHPIKVLAALVLTSFVLVMISLSTATPIRAGNSISLSTTTPYTQNFDGMGLSATAHLPDYWRVDRDDSNVRSLGDYATAFENTQYWGGNGDGSVYTGIYNFGAGPYDTAGDRAIGFLAVTNGTRSGNVYAYFTNDTGVALSSVIISYKIEKYRKGINDGFRMQMYYLIDGTEWTPAGLDFMTSFLSDSANGGYGSAPGDTKVVSNKTLTVAIPSGSDFYLAWNYSIAASASTTSNAPALALDDFSILGVAVPTPPSVVSTDPANGATSIRPSTTLTINFDENVDLTTSAVTLECPAGSPFTLTGLAAIDVSSVTLTPSGSLPAEMTCTGTVVADQVTDRDSTSSTMTSNYTWSFTTAPPDLSINDVSLNEGDTGTTTFAFTVTLSVPAPIGGVTFDISTFDNTAIAATDYISQSLTGRTISEGDNTWAFDVSVRGDTSVEPDEDFYVRVTNVTGATVVDGEGIGTIFDDDTPATFLNPVPTLTSVSPTSVQAGAVGITLTLTGANFVSTSVALWDGVDLTTTFVSSTNLTASVPASNLQNVGSHSVSVSSPEPGGGISNSISIRVDPYRIFTPLVEYDASSPPN